MNQGYWIGKVRVLNRRDCCGNRLARTIVTVDGKECGRVQTGTKNGQWYDVTCKSPLFGKTIRLTTEQKTYLSISGF
jgi:hypothetical protein